MVITRDFVNLRRVIPVADIAFWDRYRVKIPRLFILSLAYFGYIIGYVNNIYRIKIVHMIYVRERIIIYIEEINREPFMSLL